MNILFQFTPLREGRHRYVMVSQWVENISIHAPPRGATKKRAKATLSDAFQFTPLREGRPTFLETHRTPRKFQFTPLREGRPATLTTAARKLLFQFTPLREGRPDGGGAINGNTNFNSRPSARGDDYVIRDGITLAISIHAPPRGATKWKRKRKPRRYFNSRPSARGDQSKKQQRKSATFQFTPLREGRRVRLDLEAYRLPYFNSRPSARGDEKRKTEWNETLISIHAPPRGATACPRDGRAGLAISIHAPPRGATAKDMQFLQIFCSTLTNQHGLTIVPRNLSRLFW